MTRIVRVRTEQLSYRIGVTQKVSVAVAPVTHEDCLKIIKSLKNSKSGVDSTPARLFQSNKSIYSKSFNIYYKPSFIRRYLAKSPENGTCHAYFEKKV